MSYWKCSLCKEHIPFEEDDIRLPRHTLYHMTTTFRDGHKRWNVTGRPKYTLVIDRNTKFEYEEPEWEHI
jgi:hypothetical protein